MKNSEVEQSGIDFYRYPPVGEDDWRYGFAAGKIRVLETVMLSRATLLDMANAESFAAAMDLLSGTDYAFPGGVQNFSEFEKLLMDRRREARELFAKLMEDEPLVELLRARDDFSNMRMAVRRLVTERPIGADYSNEGSVPAEMFEEIFEQENYSRFPEYLQNAVEAAVLGYYEDKDIRRIDYEIDKAQAAYKLQRAIDIDCPFLYSLFRIQIDLNNIRTLLRLKAAERDERNLFLPNGFVEIDKFVHALEVGYEAVAPMFFATPYYEVVEGGIAYFTSHQSFLRLERLCEEYLAGFLRTTSSLAAGHQPIIAYLMMKEQEIRMVRMIMTGKHNGMDARLILDRLGE
jgi:V/A-type H+-transporting ATPase subunit C